MRALHDLDPAIPTANRRKATPPQSRQLCMRRDSPAQPQPRRDLADQLSAISGELDHVIVAARLGRTRRDRDQVIDDIERLALALRRSVRGAGEEPA